MKRQILLLAIGILGACSLHAQETQNSLMQTSQEAAKTAKARKSTGWSKQPIGYVFGGVGVGHIVSSEEGATGVNMNTGLDWRVGMSRFYKRWGWGRSSPSMVPWAGAGCAIRKHSRQPVWATTKLQPTPSPAISISGYPIVSIR